MSDRDERAAELAWRRETDAMLLRERLRRAKAPAGSPEAIETTVTAIVEEVTEEAVRRRAAQAK